MKRALSVSIVLRFPVATSLQLVALLERSLDAADATDRLAVNWNYPLHPLFSDSSSRADRVVQRLKGRTGDLHVPMGFLGCYHPLLAPDELKREIRWMEKNPWNEGLATLMGAKPEAFFPACVDLTRESVMRIYKEGPPLLVPNAACDRLYLGNGSEFRTYHLLKVSGQSPRRLSSQLARWYSRDAFSTAVVIIDETTAAAGDTERLLRAIGGLARSKTAFEILPITQLSNPSGGLGSLPERSEALSIPNDPVSRRFRTSLASLPKARKRGADDLMRRRLERLTMVDAETAKGLIGTDQPPAVKERTLGADMSGEITLAEARLSFQFRDGRLIDVLDGTHAILSGAASTGRFVRGDRIQEYSTISAFSFEDQRGRGLRVLQGLRGEAVVSPGQIIADFYFEEGKELLLVSLNVTHPEFEDDTPIAEYSVIEIPLFSLGVNEHLAVEGEYPDGDRYDLEISPSHGQTLLVGNDFRFTFEDRQLSINLLSAKGAPPESLPVRFRTIDGRSLFCINPFGSYTSSPVAAFSGMQERLELTINAQRRNPFPSAENAIQQI